MTNVLSMLSSPSHSISLSAHTSLLLTPRHPHTSHLELHVQVTLRVREHAHRRLGLPQLVVDVDERLDGGAGAGGKLHLLQAERAFCEFVKQAV